MANGKSQKSKALILMSFLAVIWGTENVMASIMMDSMPTFVILFCKYVVAFLFITVVMLVSGARDFVKLKDYPLFILCALTGIVLYFYCEYAALEYISVSLTTIILTFVPILSILIERFILKRKFNSRIYFGVVITIIGVVFVIGVDANMFAGGKFIGIILAFGAVGSWNAYNFIAERIASRYHYINIAWTQLLCTMLITLPGALSGIREAEFNSTVIVCIVILGIASAGCGYMILPISLNALGPTLTGMFSNFMPIVATIGGWIVLSQSITPVQIAGSAVVIAASCFVIREKGKLDD